MVQRLIFEDKYSELKDDLGLKLTQRRRFGNVPKKPGKLFMSQSVTFCTSLSLQDSISYNQDLLMHVGHVNRMGPSCAVATPTTSLDCCLLEGEGYNEASKYGQVQPNDFT